MRDGAIAEPGPEDADTIVIARVLAGDTEAFEPLMRRHNRRVFRAARAILRNDDEAEDAMQEAYVSAFAHLAAFDGRAKFSTWLVKIAVHEALRRRRRGDRFAPFDEADFEEKPMATTKSPEAAANDAELRVLIEHAVDALPVAFRTVFVLRAVEELTVSETAAALDIPEETVRTRLHRARGLLREGLTSKFESVTPQAFDFHLSRCDRVVAAVLARIRAARP
jgi:RNA polymerase sigma-70 factor, ECF subfamily